MPSRLIKDPVRYKTVLCDKYLTNGTCPYGHKCQFAHGTDELRERSDKEKQAKRCRACVDGTEAAPPQPDPASVARAASPSRTSPSRLELHLPPGLGFAEPARKVVTWAPSEVVPAGPPPSPPTPPYSQPPPTPSTPPKLAENESPQIA